MKLLCSHTVIKDVSWMGGGGGWRCRGARAGGRYWLRIINRCIVHIVRFASKGHICILPHENYPLYSIAACKY